MNRLDTTRRVQVISALVEGSSLRSTSRMTGVAINTVVKLAVDAGAACSEYQDRIMRNLKCQRIQVDEIWSFCYAKARNVTPEIAAKNPHAGDTWTFTAIDADSKLIPCWLIGPRDAVTARMFINDLADRLTDRIQLTSDGLGVYRANLSMRMGMRRYTRLTNAFSKKIENHAAAVALYFMFYNFARVHKTLRCSPAMAAGVDNRLWDIKDIVEMIDAYEQNNSN